MLVAKRHCAAGREEVLSSVLSVLTVWEAALLQQLTFSRVPNANTVMGAALGHKKSASVPALLPNTLRPRGGIEGNALR